ncbi:hypothetical protein PPL_06859 [Heterostelium album PN500]|uniref:ABC transporter domain-containing protein n=1 Tax=Heterostelium pallidum (strain ATCC 26659 / Pp 5 / PN500) TaxID=670386 RepID=D3BDQ7_HETP5|nr:hypothetical protein PPL_06859 [Heterostelium album PN500]EFA80038.1 hypothetical protein PPL_06859 [Heterostelium album PN500]|eukprot:XP_020432158.1 hypothetical protein PPL_06859 [Heterostelium album PN500]
MINLIPDGLISLSIDKQTFHPVEPIVFNYQVHADYDLQYNFGNVSDAARKRILNSIQTTMGWQPSRMMELPNGTDQQSYFSGQLTSQVNANMSFASVFFNQTDDTNIYYNLAYNQNDGLIKSSLIIMRDDGDDQLRYSKAIRYAIEKGIIDVFTQGQAKVTTYSQQPPSFRTGNRSIKVSTSILAMFYPVFLVLGITFPFILFVYLIVEEKELKIRAYLRAFGVIDTIYFSTWIIDGMLVALFNTHFGIGVLLSSILSRTRAAMIFAIIIFCIVLIGSLVLSLLTDILYGLWSNEPKYYNWLIAFQILTPLNFLKIMVDISTVTINTNFMSSKDNDQNSKSLQYEWSNFVNHNNNANSDRPVTTTYNTNNYIFIATLIYFFLAWFFDKVVPDSFGGRRVPWFFATKSFWWPNSIPDDVNEYDLRNNFNSNDPDIQHESTCVNTDNFDNYSLVVRNLVKRYGSKKVVDNLSFSAEKGKIIAMLGHNGAGKTTTINMITGQTIITGGNIFVQGYNVNTQIDYVKTMIGLCPQFDVYWPDFTAREHLTIMTLVKEKRTNIKHDINEILQSVRLSSVADNIVSSYSGGMRRRLSVAIGIIGDPQVIVLDEPTTGIDPANRRYIWKLIKSIKKDKLILLTTHSMEEADALGDKIIIMDGGKLSGAGTSLHLKDRFGTGYKLHLVTTNIEEAQQLVQNQLPVAKLDRINSMNLVYTIPSMEQLSSFLKFLTVEKSIDKLITDWQIQNTTLEDVFLQMVRKPEDKNMEVPHQSEKINLNLYNANYTWLGRSLIFPKNILLIPDCHFTNSKWVDPRISQWSCVDGRGDKSELGTLGGDSGEFLLGVAAWQQITGTSDDYIIDKMQILFNDFLEIQPNPMYMHTDDHAEELATTKMREIFNDPNLVINFTNPDPEYQDELMNLLTDKNYIGCGHIRLIMNNPDKYNLSTKIVSEYLRHFYYNLWVEDYDKNVVYFTTEKNQTKQPCFLLGLHGDHHESSSMIVDITNFGKCENRVLTTIPNPQNCDSSFIFHSNKVLDASIRGRVKRFFSNRLDKEYSKFSDIVDQIYSKWQKLSVGFLAPNLPIYQVNITIH